MRPKISCFQILTFKCWIHGAKSTHRLKQQDWESRILPVHTNFPLRFCAPWRPENVCNCYTLSISDVAFHNNLTCLLSHDLHCMCSVCKRNDKQTWVYRVSICVLQLPCFFLDASFGVSLSEKWRNINKRGTHKHVQHRSASTISWR